MDEETSGLTCTSTKRYSDIHSLICSSVSNHTLSHETVLKCYPFQGCADGSINNILVQVESQGDLPNSPMTSGDQTVIEDGKQAGKLSSVPPKLGELMSAMNTSAFKKLAGCSLKKWIKNKVTAKGIYIDRQHHVLLSFRC